MRLTSVEILQTSAMDCGPAALASLLASLGRPIDLAKLREACQTDLDGTSIDVMEQVAAHHGLTATQQMLPADRLPQNLPALVVTRLPDGAPHFVTIWRSVGPWLQVMDPARGNHWARTSRFLPTLLHHSLPVPTSDWEDWAKGPANLTALRQMARRLGLPDTLITQTAAETGWFPLAALEAALRLTLALPGGTAALTRALIHETRGAEADIFRLIPPAFWPVIPDPNATRAAPSLLLQGAVLLTITGPAQSSRQPRPRRPSPLFPAVFQGKLPVFLLIGTVLTVLGTLAEALTFRRLIDPTGSLPLAIALVAALYLARLTLGTGILALGRRVEARWRGAVMGKLLRLPDRWIASRPLGDLAERVQSLHMMRTLPGQVLHLAQAVTEVVALSLGLILIAPASAPWMVALCALSLGWPFVMLPLLRDRDLTLRSLGAAQAGMLMDALQGQAALRAHRGAGVLTARFAQVLQDWQTTARTRATWAATAGAAGQALVLTLTALLILTRPSLDLLFLWWLMKLPGSAADLSAILRQIPAQEAILTRAAEPLNTPARPLAPLPMPLAHSMAIGITLTDAHVTAAGHPVLNGVSLSVAQGEAIAVVGPSGSGKSSLLGLLMGWHDLTQGQMQVNGQTLTAAQRHSLTQRFAWVDPTARLWGDTIADTPGHPTQADLNLPPETPIGSGGVALSAGEGQRLRLSRALAHPDPALVLCDEALRGLDAPRRRALLALARQHWAGRTLIWVTHDLNEAMGFDRVVVMQDGQVAEDGAPQDLMSRNGAFVALWHAQSAMEARMARDWHEVRVEGFQAQAGHHVQPAA